jgi:sterol carrier protein 2
MSSQVYVAGVGMIPFAKPGNSAPYHVMGAEATKLALADAGLDYSAVEQAYVGYVYGDSTCGQRALYPVGMSGIPIINVNNNCSTGSTALFMARQAIASGAVDCVLALGFEQMKPGALGAVFTDRPSAFDEFDAAADKLVDAAGIPLALRYFGGAGLSHMKKYGTPLTSFAKVRAKASRHAVKNPLALFRKEVSADDVMNDQVIWPGVMTRLMACPPTCGGAAALLVSDKFAEQARPAQGCADRGASHDHRYRIDLRRRRHDAGGRLRHDARGRDQGLRGGGHRSGRPRCGRAA